MPYATAIPKNSAPPLAPYSPDTKADNIVYVSDMLATDPEGNLVGAGDVKRQMRHVLETINSVLEATGESLMDVTFNHIFLASMNDYGAMNEVYREQFPKDPLAQYRIRAELVKPEFLVEIASIAHLEK